jgi:hypothetical protein
MLVQRPESMAKDRFLNQRTVDVSLVNSGSVTTVALKAGTFNELMECDCLKHDTESVNTCVDKDS